MHGSAAQCAQNHGIPQHINILVCYLLFLAANCPCVKLQTAAGCSGMLCEWSRTHCHAAAQQAAAFSIIKVISELPL